MGNQLINKNEIRRCSSPSPPLDTTTVLSSLTRMLPLRLCLTPSWFPPSNPPSTPPSPRPLPSRTSRRLSPLESSRDLMMDNHSSRLPEREGHRRYAAIDQRYGEKTWYYAFR